MRIYKPTWAAPIALVFVTIIVVRSAVEWYLVNVNLAGTPHQSGWQFVGIIMQAPFVIILSLIISFFAGYFVKRSRRRIFLETSFIIILFWESFLFTNSMNPERISTSENATYNQRTTNGYWEYYHENGGLKSKGNYEDGLEVGVWEHYYENGNRKDLWDYGDDRMYRTHKAFRETGELLWERSFFYGDLHGTWISYYQDGSIRIKSNWEQGKELNQTRFIYHEDGQLMRRAEFKGDDFNGLREDFHENGKLKQTGSYQDGKPIGIWKVFDEEGNLTSSDEF